MPDTRSTTNSPPDGHIALSQTSQSVKSDVTLIRFSVLSTTMLLLLETPFLLLSYVLNLFEIYFDKYMTAVYLT